MGHRTTRRRSVRVIVIGAIALTLLPACSSKKTPIQMGLKRVALDLAFKADPDAKLPPKVLVQDLPPLPTPVPAYTLTADNTTLTRVAPTPTTLPPVVRVTCPTAEAGSVPSQAVSVGITKPVLGGRYGVRNKGLVKFGGTFTFSGPYPPLTTMDVRNVVDKTSAPDATGATTRTLTFDVVEALGDNSTTTTYSASPTALQITKRVTKTGQVTTTFQPTPAITVVGLGSGEGQSWNSAGTDLNNGTSAVVQGKTLSRQSVDVCGTMVDTYRVQSTERWTSLNGTNAYSSVTKDTTNTPGATGPGLPNFYNVATHLGGLFISIETHMTTVAGALTIDIDNVATLDSIEPKPLS
jgi:hypothetical protein